MKKKVTVLINDSLYQLTTETIEPMLDAIREIASPNTIYCVHKDMVYQFENDTFKSKKSLEVAVKEYNDAGFKCFYK